MKNKLILISTVFASLMFSACDSELDINVDPQRSSSAEPNSVFPFVFAEYSARKVTELGTRIIDVPQQWSDTFNSPKNGTTSIFLTGNTWGVWYGGLLGNLELLRRDAIAAGETSNNIQAVALIMQAHLFFELTSLWGDIPYTQALNGEEFPTPEFDTQEVVLRGVISQYDEAIALIDAMPATGNFDFSFGDLIYGGNIDQWRALANSWKLRTLMILRNQDTTVDTQIIATLGQPLIESLADVAFFPYEGGAGARNGFYNIIFAFFGPSNEDADVFGPAPVFRDQLVNSNDPRVNVLFADLSGTGTYPVAEYDQFPVNDETVWSDDFIRDDLPDVYYLPGETAFYRAELALKGVINGGSLVAAQGYFEDGITKTLQYYGGAIDGFRGTPLTSTEISTFATSIDLSTLTNVQALEQVHLQQWVETLFRPVVAWNTVRRTKVPVLAPGPNSSITTILKRFDYPPDEIGANPNTPVNPPTDTPQWFEN